MSDWTILITGASGGIGRATAQAFVAAGWRVGLVVRRQDALREAAGDAISALIVPCDVTDPASVDLAFAPAVREWGASTACSTMPASASNQCSSTR